MGRKAKCIWHWRKQARVTTSPFQAPAAHPPVPLGATIRLSGCIGFVHIDNVARLLSVAISRPLACTSVLTITVDTTGMAAFVEELAWQSG